MSQPIFGVNLSTSAEPSADPVAAARRAEELDFDFVSSSDHPCGPHPTNEVWTMLAWVAASTTRIRLASRVLAVPFRNAVLLAKMAETLDRLSNGRLILGLGAGASNDEFRSMGLQELSNAAKIIGLEEAVEVVRGVWTSEAHSSPGTRHRAVGAEVYPKPVRPIPVWLGTFGDRALAATGRLADGWIPSLGYAPEARLGEMRDRVVTAAVDAGRRSDDIECILNLEIRVESRQRREGDALVGPPRFLEARLQHFLNLGFNGFNFIAVGPGLDDQHRRIADEVVSLLRPR